MCQIRLQVWAGVDDFTDSISGAIELSFLGCVLCSSHRLLHVTQTSAFYTDFCMSHRLLHVTSTTVGWVVSECFIHNICVSPGLIRYCVFE